MPGSPFRFRLERVRALRERHEDAAKQALAGAMVQQQRCAEEVQAAADRVAEARRAQLSAATEAISGMDLLHRQAYLERTERAHQATRHDLGRHDVVVTQRREALVHAARERQALERLKQSRQAEHDREVARQEGLALDEIAINGFRRKAA